MTAAPVTAAIPLVRRSIYQALAPLMGAYQDGNGNAKAYWMQAEQGIARPFVVFQSQDLGGMADDYIGTAGWEGLIALRALADTQSATETLLGVVLPGMGSLALPSGYTGYSISATWERPLVVPPTVDGIWTSGALYRVSIYRS